ncbi:uncharacterized protein LOC134502418 [Candoia aspera]|uniref:uncharacterized protein LOC134502418 n=1 Tax=Candoia aspera TaxID=51853 RepID=UPI002FD7B80D
MAEAKGKIAEIEQASQAVLAELCTMEVEYKIEKTCREQAEAFAIQMSRENKKLKRISLALLPRLGLLQGDLANWGSGEDAAAPESALDPMGQYLQQIKDLQLKVSWLLEEKKELAAQVKDLQSHMEKLQDQLEEEHVEKQALKVLKEHNQKILKRVKQASHLVTKEYGKMSLKLDLEEKLRQQAETFAHQMLVKQKAANRQSMILMQDVGADAQLLLALEEVAKMAGQLEEAKLEHEAKVQDLEAQLAERPPPGELAKLQAAVAAAEEGKAHLEEQLLRSEERCVALEQKVKDLEEGAKTPDAPEELPAVPLPPPPPPPLPPPAWPARTDHAGWALRMAVQHIRNAAALAKLGCGTLVLRIPAYWTAPCESRVFRVSGEALLDVCPLMALRERKGSQHAKQGKRTWGQTGLLAPGPEGGPDRLGKDGKLVALQMWLGYDTHRPQRLALGVAGAPPGQEDLSLVGSLKGSQSLFLWTGDLRSDDATAKAVEEMMARIKSGVVLRPVRREAESLSQASKLPSAVAGKRRSAAMELQSLLSATRRPGRQSGRRKGSQKKLQVDNQLDLLLQRRRRIVDCSAQTPALPEPSAPAADQGLPPYASWAREGGPAASAMALPRNHQPSRSGSLETSKDLPGRSQFAGLPARIGLFLLDAPQLEVSSSRRRELSDLPVSCF